MARNALEGSIEALLFIAHESMSAKAIADALQEDASAVKEALLSLRNAYAAEGSGIILDQVGDSWRLATNPEYFDALESYVASEQLRPLSEAALEVLAVVAYTQPCTRDTVRSIRGVNSDSILTNLVAKGLIKEVGRTEAPSNARLYGTTTLFLEHFGFASTKDLPSLEAYSADEAAFERIKAQLEQHMDVVEPTDNAAFEEDE